MDDMSDYVGAVVVLASGGPSMTITGYDAESDLLQCIWFDDEGRMEEHWFPEAALLFEEAVEVDNDDDEREEDEEEEDEEYEEDCYDIGVTEESCECCDYPIVEELMIDETEYGEAGNSENYVRSEEEGWFYGDETPYWGKVTRPHYWAD